MQIEKPDEAVLAEIEAHAVKIARQAGQIVFEQFRKPLEVKFKGNGNSDPVTAADRLSEEYLKKAIREKFPLHNILGEEGGVLNESDSPFVWVLDPLDGTINFTNGLPLFGVSVGVLWNGQAAAGSIWVPVSQRGSEGVYHARVGKGAFLNAEKIEVSTSPPGRPLCEIPVGSRLGLSGKNLKEPHEARNLGSIALEMAMAAGGVFQYAVFGSPKIWDVAAGVLLVKEAGGVSLIRKPGEKSWVQLERFEPERNDGSASLENLRKWSLPVVAGTPEAAGKVVKDIRIRRGLLSRVTRRIWSVGSR